MLSNELEAILNRIEAGDHTVEDLAMLRQLLGSQNHSLIQQLDGKYNIHIEQGRNIHIGDRTYVSWSKEAIQALIQAIRADQSDASNASLKQRSQLFKQLSSLPRPQFEELLFVLKVPQGIIRSALAAQGAG